MRIGWGLAGVAIALVVAAPAQASSATIITVDVGDRLDVILQEQLIVTAGKGERNRLRLRSSGAGGVEIRDSGATLRARAGCTRKSRHVAVCRPDDVIEVLEVGAGNRNDRVRLGKGLPGDVAVRGGPGNDRLTGSSDGERLDGGVGGDRLAGGGGADSLDGGEGRDVLLGGAGPDTLNAGDGRRAVRDRLDGGSGFDVASWAGSSARVRVRLSRGVLRGGVDRGKRLEGLRGGSGRDRLVGSAKGDDIDGGEGADVIIGRGGNDRLTPGDTPDEKNVVGCGAGRDEVIFSQLWTVIRGDCERIVDPFDDSVRVRPRIRIIPGGRVEAAAYCGEFEEIACFLEIELRSPPPRSRRLAPKLDEPENASGPTAMRFTLNAAGREYLGDGGKTVCVSDGETGYCMRVPRS